MVILNALTRRHKAASTVALVVAAVIIIAVALSYVLLSANSTITINTATTLNITKSASILRIGDGTYAIALVRTTPNHNAAYVYLNRLPAFMNPLLNVTLYPGQATKINSSTSSANIELQLTSASNSAATLVITPISANLNLLPDSAYIATVRTALQSITPSSSNSVTTTIPPRNTNNTGTTVTSVPTTVSTTIASGTNTTRAKITATLQKSIYYPLMLNYSTIYAKTLNCTPALYNTTYAHANGVAPSGYSTFQNISQMVPYAIYNSTSSAGSGLYSVVYYTRTRASTFNNVAALTIEINASAESLHGATFSGIFLGSNYTTLLNGYRNMATIGNACEAYVT